MILSAIIPLIAAIILFVLLIVILRFLLKTRLITLLFIAMLPTSFGIWMISRAITASSTEFLDVFRLANVCYIMGPLFLIYFIDLISKGKFTWVSVVFSFFAGSMFIGVLFLDYYSVEYDVVSGWVMTEYNIVVYLFTYFFVFIIIFIIFGEYLIRAYKRNKDKERRIFKKILIVYFFSATGTIIFSFIRSLRLIDFPFINSFDALFLSIGFGYLCIMYLKYTYLFHLEMLDIQLIGLIVYDKQTGILMYSYEFKTTETIEKELISGIFSGINMIFREILKNEQSIKEVRHGSNNILFEEGKVVTIGLITNLSTILTRNWLYQFRMEFEKEFRQELDLFATSNILDLGQKPDALVKKIFLYK